MGNEYNLSVVWRSLYRINVMEKNTILLPNGELMPIIGFGTWQVKFFYFISIFYIYTFNNFLIFFSFKEMSYIFYNIF